MEISKKITGRRETKTFAHNQLQTASQLRWLSLCISIVQLLGRFKEISGMFLSVT